MVAGERVAGAGVVDEAPVRLVAEVGAGVEAAQAERRAAGVALAGVVEDDVEDHADAGGAQRRDGGGELADAAGAEARVGRHEGHRVVAPAVGQAERAEVALVDPGGDRHQLDRVDAEARQVVEDRRVGERRDGAALGLGHVRVQQGERPHRHLVDQPAGAEDRRRRRGRRGQGGDHRLRHQRGGVERGGARRRQPVVVGEGPVERGRVGVDEQLRRVEAVPGRPRPARRRGGRSACRRRGRRRWRRRPRRGRARAGCGRSPRRRRTGRARRARPRPTRPRSGGRPRSAWRRAAFRGRGRRSGDHVRRAAPGAARGSRPGSRPPRSGRRAPRASPARAGAGSSS